MHILKNVSLIATIESLTATRKWKLLSRILVNTYISIPYFHVRLEYRQAETIIGIVG